MQYAWRWKWLTNSFWVAYDLKSFAKSLDWLEYSFWKWAHNTYKSHSLNSFFIELAEDIKSFS